MKHVTVYTRKNCHLCHEALKVVETLKSTHSFDLKQVDIDTEMDGKDPRHSRFAVEIPVVEVDGSEVYTARTDASCLAQRLLDRVAT